MSRLGFDTFTLVVIFWMRVGAEACSPVGFFEALNIARGALAEIMKGVNKVK
jgi:hypothetical protein